MPPRPEFAPLQAQEIARAFAAEGVDYLFIGKSGAILLGYPGVTQDVDLFLPKDPGNALKVIAALERLGFELDEPLRQAILVSRDFVQIKSGPFDVDLVHAPDGIKNFAVARERRILHEGFPVASLRDIIESKRASGREKDLIELNLLEDFRREYERHHAPPLRSAADIALRGQEPLS
jgi:hypothetical protein